MMAFHDVETMSYKQKKEEFVSNLSGTSMLEVAAVCGIVPGFVVLCQWGFPLSLGDQNNNMAYHNEDSGASGIAGWKNIWFRFVLEFLLVIFPTFMCITMLEDKLLFWTTCILCIVIIVLTIRKKQRWKPMSRLKENTVNVHKKLFISSHRFVVMLLTCISILAVDFTVYPRRFAKTEIYGTSLMDVGVGSFVVLNGLVSRQARGLPPSKYGGILRNTSPLLIMGFARLFLIKGADYQVHVGEYGVHWNFFFTMAAVALLTSFIHVPSKYCGIFGVAILSAYQVILLSGLNKYLSSATRGPSILSLNKEGIFSLFGYWGLYMVSVWLGHYLFYESGKYVGRIFKGHRRTNEGKASEQLQSAIEIWILGIIFWLATYLLNTYVEEVSRRMCNMAYVMFVLAVNFEGIGILVFSEFIPNTKSLLVEENFNDNFLATFLLANILTGLVNVSMNTLSASTVMAYVVLTAYLATLVIGTLLMKSLHLKLKFW